MSVRVRSQRWLEQPALWVAEPNRTSLAQGLLGAWLPEPSGYTDTTSFRNNARTRTGAPVFQPTPRAARGAAHNFTTSDYFTGGSTTPAFSSAGWSIALWVNFTTGTPTNYGSVLGRAAGAGSDWEIDHEATNRRLIWARNGAVLFQATSTVNGGEWHLWHLTVDASGNGTWYTDAAANGTTTALTARTADGAVYFNNRSSSNPANSAIGRVYFWNRANTQAEVQALYREEWALFEPERIWVPKAGSTPSTIGGGTLTFTSADLAGSSTAQSTLDGSTLTFTGAALTGSSTAQSTPDGSTLVFNGADIVGSSGASVIGGSTLTFTSADLAGSSTAQSTPDGSTLVFSGATLTGSDASAVPAPAQTGAGRPSRRRRRYQVEIDGETFDVESPGEAEQVLAKAREAAEEQAEQAVALAAKRTGRVPVGKVLRDARKALPVPEIRVSPDLQAVADQWIADIRKTYESALATIEIAALLRDRERAIEEDDEEVLLLL